MYQRGLGQPENCNRKTEEYKITHTHRHTQTHVNGKKTLCHVLYLNILTFIHIPCKNLAPCKKSCVIIICLPKFVVKRKNAVGECLKNSKHANENGKSAAGRARG